MTANWCKSKNGSRWYRVIACGDSWRVLECLVDDGPDDRYHFVTLETSCCMDESGNRKYDTVADISLFGFGDGSPGRIELCTDERSPRDVTMVVDEQKFVDIKIGDDTAERIIKALFESIGVFGIVPNKTGKPDGQE